MENIQENDEKKEKKKKEEVNIEIPMIDQIISTTTTSAPASFKGVDVIDNHVTNREQVLGHMTGEEEEDNDDNDNDDNEGESQRSNHHCEQSSCNENTYSKKNQLHPMILNIDIIDTGCGMDQSSQKRVGELDFFSGKAGGFGLGTFIVRTYVQALYGSFHIKSEVGVGTTMTIGIPTYFAKHAPITYQSSQQGTAMKDNNEEPESKRLKSSSSPTNAIQNVSSLSSSSSSSSLSSSLSSSSSCSSSSSHIKSKSVPIPRSPTIHDNDTKVLVVEDINVNRKLIVKSLERGGFKVDQAENGAVGLKMMLENKYNTVFMDIDMPVMNGDEAIREYWKQCQEGRKEEGKHPKIIMLTGNITDADREMALACGADEFLTKPVVPKQLWDAASWNVYNQD
eukprot:CAMPEP_0114340022 /NCGR_PEP_ID=MMETSP0101-20121206/8107_1 /TAXON_ID=38822 ORGANISM="Pteridomonas danica, Strain PT" /NCGR_SAMPLE_ID=MMETSP0101 /ASSEMBLY_ACC=CAM_ASM_000211 /LENGTH=395 /DNA_ID=CAMNT_0001473161 /DNA_START=1120 /DNA_END=2307 /DNA_ORIENTATION=-